MRELSDRIAARMTRLRSAGQLRTLKPPAGIDLSSNDYLCLARNELLRERMAEAARREGCGSTGSRLLRGERTEWSALERRFAGFKGTEAALYFTSGYMANLAVLSTFLEPGDTVFSDSLNHASIIDGIRLGRAEKVIFPHGDVTALRTALAAQATGQRFLVTESVFSMDGDFAPLAEYTALAKQHDCALVVDEAHAAGIYGTHGSGLAEDVLLSVNPMGKAFGVAGAFVCGPQWAVEYLLQRARPFIFSTAAPVALASALNAALDLIERHSHARERVLHLTAFVRGLLADAGFPVARQGSQIIPVIIGDNQEATEVAATLQHAGFDVRAIRPPTVPEGTARLRISVNAGLTEAVLRDFAAALISAAAKVTA